MCIQLYYKPISMYLNKHVKYLQFLRMEFSSLSTVGNPESSFFLLFLFFFLLPIFPFLCFYYHYSLTHFLAALPLLICTTQFPFNNCLTGNLLWSSCVPSCGRREREWYSRNLPSKCQCSSQGTRPLIPNTRQSIQTIRKIGICCWTPA